VFRQSWVASATQSNPEQPKAFFLLHFFDMRQGCATQCNPTGLHLGCSGLQLGCTLQPRATQSNPTCKKHCVFTATQAQPRATQSNPKHYVFYCFQRCATQVQPSWVALGLHLGCTWVALGCSWVFPKIVPKPSRNPEKAMGNLPVIAFPPKMCLSLPKTKKNCK